MYDIANMTDINSSAKHSGNVAYFAVVYGIFLVAVGIYILPRCPGPKIVPV